MKLLRTVLLPCLLCCLAGSMMASDANSPFQGKWHVVAQTEDAPREFDAEFLVSVDGHVSGTFATAAVTGAATADSLTVEFPWRDQEGGKGIAKLKGRMNGDQLVGTWAFNTYDGSFKASRPKPPEN